MANVNMMEPWYPLRSLYPHVYESLLQQLATHGLHSYDVYAEATALTGNPGGGHRMAELRIRYGTDYAYSAVTEITEAQTLAPDDSLLHFFDDTASLCHEAVRQAYKDFMKTQ